jgi:hypothetical protein
MPNLRIIPNIESVEISSLFELSLPSELSNSKERICKICNSNIDLSKMRLHIGIHILKKDVDNDVCGFCGLKCGSVSQINSKLKLPVPVSNCKYFYMFSLASVTNIKDSRSSAWSSNRPVKCKDCTGDVFVWSYSIQEHYSLFHTNIECDFKISEKESLKLLQVK